MKTEEIIWSTLIIQAENWSHGDEKNGTTEVLKFIAFALAEVV